MLSLKCYQFLFLLFLCSFHSLSTKAQIWKWGVGSINSTASATEAWPIGLDSIGNIYESGSLGSSSGSDTNMAVFGADTVYAIGAAGQLIVVSSNSTGTYRWAICAGGAPSTIYNESSSFPLGMATDSSGNVYVFGCYLGSTITLGTRSAGNPLANTDGETMFFIAKISSSGQPLWIKNVAPANLLAMTGTLAMDYADNLYITGTFTDSAITIGTTTIYNHDPSGMSSDVFIAKLDSSGTAVWAKDIGGDTSELAQAIAVTRWGDIYCAGTFYSGSLAIGDTLVNSSSGALPYFYIAKYDNSGNPVWARKAAACAAAGDTFNVCSHTVISGITTDNWSNVYLACSAYDTLSFGSDTLFNSASQLFAVLAGYSPAGNLKFAKAVTGTSIDTQYTNAYSVAADYCGKIWVSGGCTQISTLDGMFLSEFDTSGAHLFTTVQPGGGDDQNGLVLDNLGFVYVGGDYQYAPLYIGPEDTLNLYGGISSESLFILALSYPDGLCPIPANDAVPQIASPAIFNLFPNPAGTMITISSSEKINTLRLSNILGQEVYTGSYNDTEVQVNIAGLSPGIYFLKINGVGVKKFIKE